MGHRDPDIKHRVPKPIQPPAPKIKKPAPKTEEEKKSGIAIVEAKQVFSKRMLIFE